ncbi:MAG: hypothetical protein HN742_40405 [Lentisphaerae bacterium]|nr:hypothetical protein [Lentisphaerota bacterium]MBT4820647.1 hypothetical protein [Lentisphaerota bacterium]MBT5610277.1 hypothetical protein [Lentisphaerota bacterium]MBT7059179.1 hypothetical protein [Lentisphaerota bacterium]MBT7848197.1 hypothetical protein [Lentisphaerota bacterium]
MSQPQSSHAYVLNVMSDDHPGIVSAVTNAICSLGGNITACSQTVVGGYFTLIIVATFPEAVETEALKASVEGPDQDVTGFQVSVRRCEAPGSQAAEPLEQFVVTAFGKDKPGIIRRFAQYLADKDINITDLFGDRSGDDFVLIAQVQVPPHWSITMIQADLEEMGNEEGFTVRFQHENVFVATNQLRLAHSHGK